MKAELVRKIGIGLVVLSPIPILYVATGFLFTNPPGHLGAFIVSVFSPFVGRLGLRLSQTTDQRIRALPTAASIVLTIVALAYLTSR